MGRVYKATRAQLQAIQGLDERGIRCFESLFAAGFLVTGDVIYTGARTREGALLANGQAIERVGFADLFKVLVPVSVVTITIASPGVVTWASHGLSNDVKVQFATSPGGTLPTGIVAGTVYFTKNVATNTFQIAATAGGAAINTSGTQSGNHTATAFPHGNGDGTTTFNVPTFPAVGNANAFIIY